jgi:hypothetical protein
LDFFTPKDARVSSEAVAEAAVGYVGIKPLCDVAERWVATFDFLALVLIPLVRGADRVYVEPVRL